MSIGRLIARKCKQNPYLNVLKAIMPVRTFKLQKKKKKTGTGFITGRHAVLRSDFFGSIVLGQVYFAHTRNSSTAFVLS